MKTLLIIDDDKNNWYEIFKDTMGLDNEDLKIEQSQFDRIKLTAYSDSGVVCNVFPARNPIPETSMEKKRLIKPDFLLVRSVIKGVSASNDYKNLLYGFKFANISSVNSLDSIYQCMERPWVYSELLKLNKKLGDEAFPLIKQYYYSHHTEMIITPQYPLVVKVGHAHAGYGKMLFHKHNEFNDFSTIVALHSDYVTTEPFIENDYDLRIQKIGTHYRAFKRTSFAWKKNVGGAIVEDIPITENYKLWADECSRFFGGLDILAVDAIHSVDEKEYILELNDTAIGLLPAYEKEDMKNIGDLVLQKMEH